MMTANPEDVEMDNNDMYKLLLCLFLWYIVCNYKGGYFLRVWVDKSCLAGFSKL